MSSLVLFTDRYRYFLYAGRADMRKSFAGLCGIVINEMHLSITDSDIFIFLNKDKTHIKILLHEDNGFTMLYRKLDRGKFNIPEHDGDTGSIALNAGDLLSVLKGLSFHRYRQYS